MQVVALAPRWALERDRRAGREHPRVPADGLEPVAEGLAERLGDRVGAADHLAPVRHREVERRLGLIQGGELTDPAIAKGGQRRMLAHDPIRSVASSCIRRATAADAAQRVSSSAAEVLWPLTLQTSEPATNSNA